MATRKSLSIAELLKDDPEMAAHVRAAEDVLEGAAFVRMLRQRAGMTQAQLAEQLGVSQPRISALEKGDGVEGMTYGMLKKIARACGVDWRIPDLQSFIARPAELEQASLDAEAEAIAYTAAGA